MKTFLFTVLVCLFIVPIHAQGETDNDSLPLQKSDKSEIKIRSHSTIRNAESPLFIIDGVPLLSGDETFQSLNPNDIVSIQVLKDPPAIFCYGAAAKYGVVLISTKAGQKPVVLKKDLPFKVYEVCNTNWNTHQEMYNAIQAKVPNTTISSNHDVGVPPRIRMRGESRTIVIVDGIQYDTSILNTLNPSDIESVKVSHSPAAQNYFINQ